MNHSLYSFRILTRLTFLRIVLPAACCSLSAADQVTFKDQTKLTGEIATLRENQTLTMRTALSPDPLELQAESIESITFDSITRAPVAAKNLLYLKAGDVMPITSPILENGELRFDTIWSGSLKVARENIDSLHFDTAENEVIYSGPNNQEWTLSNGWRFDADDNSLVSKSWGSVHREFAALPDRYILGFTVSWTGNAGIQCRIGGSSADTNSRQNAYLFQLGSSGIELKRMAAAGKYTILASESQLTPDKFEDNEVKVEIFVDRPNRLLQLVINGKKYRNNITDPLETGELPQGKFIHFTCTTGDEDIQMIQEITLSSWGAATAEARLEKRTDTKTDILFDIESNRSSGVIASISAGPSPNLLFENPHDPNPRPIPLSKIAVVYFSGKSAEGISTKYKIKFRGAGLLYVDQFAIGNGNLNVQHPLLGPIEISTSIIDRIDRNP
jgi:hypothetical protein